MTIRPIAVAALADLHCGSTMGLCPRGVALDDGGTYMLSRTQSWILEVYTEYLAQVKALSKTHEIITVANGDLCDGNHHGTAQIISPNPRVHREIAIELLEPLRRLSQRFFVTRGTAVHNSGTGRDEEEIAKDLGAEKSFDGLSSWWELRAEFGGSLWNFMHHVTGGNFNGRTRGNSMVRLARDVRDAYLDRMAPPPHFVVRAHKHAYQDSWGNVPGTRAITLPAFQALTEFTNSIGILNDPTVGGIIFVQKGSTWDAQLVSQTLPLRTWQAPSSKKSGNTTKATSSKTRTSRSRASQTSSGSPKRRRAV